MNKRNIFLWALYDFANSIIAICFFLYLSQWLVIDGGLSSLGFNVIFIASTVCLFLTAPIFAALSDKVKKRKIFLNIATLGTFIFYGATAYAASFGTDYVFIVVPLYVIAQYFYQLSFVFYHPMLEHLAPLEKRGRVSGIGQTASWVGQIAGILIAMPFISLGRAAPLLPATIAFFILALPMMIYFREEREISTEKVTWKETNAEAKRLVSRFYKFMRYSPAAFFLIAFFFFNDAILTFTNNFPIYMDKVFQITDKTKSMLMLVILVTTSVGAYVSGWLGDRIGMNKTLKIVLGSWIVIIPLIALITNFKLFVVVAFAVGTLYGAVWSVTRAYLTGVLPSEEMGYGFSFYTLMERLSTLIGPLSWGIVVSVLGDEGAGSYRWAAASMTIFVIIGYYFVRKIPLYQVASSQSSAKNAKI